MMPLHRFVQRSEQPVVVQTRVHVHIVRIERDDFVLSGLYVQQRHPQPVLHADHDVFPAASRLGDHRSLGVFEFPFGDSHPVALHQSLRLRGIDRDYVRIGASHPPEVFHRFVGEVGIIFALAVPHPRQKTV